MNNPQTPIDHVEHEHVHGTGLGAHIHGDKLALIQERVRLHPNGNVQDIVGSLELDGIHVTAEEVQEVLDQERA